jgi:hypothetical protein
MLRVVVYMADGTSTNLAVATGPIIAAINNRFDERQALDNIIAATKGEIEKMLGVRNSNQELYAVEEDDDSSGCFNLVLVDNGVVHLIEAESWSRHFCSDYNARWIKSDTTIVGDSKNYPMLGYRACSTGMHTWTLRAEGKTDCIRLGVARPSLNLATRPENKFYRNRECWGFTLTDRLMFFAGEQVVRAEGPEEFQQPCKVTLTLDCGAGTLSVVAGGLDLGVLCSTLPVNEPLHLAVTTYHAKAKLTLLSYTSSTRQGLTGTASW